MLLIFINHYYLINFTKIKLISNCLFLKSYTLILECLVLIMAQIS